jgi:hypothetical protein
LILSEHDSALSLLSSHFSRLGKNFHSGTICRVKQTGILCRVRLLAGRDGCLRDADQAEKRTILRILLFDLSAKIEVVSA